MRQLPIGVQTFEKIVEGNYVYVDKTKYLYGIIKEGSTYFLSRPRRFGKSLTISTLEAIFLGRKELFKGLWIESSDYDWKKHPVIRLDMTSVSEYTGVQMDIRLADKIRDIGKKYGIEIKEKEECPPRLY